MQYNLRLHPHLTEVTSCPWAGAHCVFQVSLCLLSPPMCQEMNKTLLVPEAPRLVGEMDTNSNYHTVKYVSLRKAEHVGLWLTSAPGGWKHHSTREAHTSVLISDLFPVEPGDSTKLKYQHSKVCKTLRYTVITLWGITFYIFILLYVLQF